jgi:hypothetical protein
LIKYTQQEAEPQNKNATLCPLFYDLDILIVLFRYVVECPLICVLLLRMVISWPKHVRDLKSILSSEGNKLDIHR